VWAPPTHPPTPPLKNHLRWRPKIYNNLLLTYITTPRSIWAKGMMVLSSCESAPPLGVGTKTCLHLICHIGLVICVFLAWIMFFSCVNATTKHARHMPITLAQPITHPPRSSYSLAGGGQHGLNCIRVLLLIHGVGIAYDTAASRLVGPLASLQSPHTPCWLCRRSETLHRRQLLEFAAQQPVGVAV
jgi:hypothetical protein